MRSGLQESESGVQRGSMASRGRCRKNGFSTPITRTQLSIICVAAFLRGKWNENDDYRLLMVS